MLEVLGALGIGGALGTLFALAACGKRLGDRLALLRADLESIAKDPAHADLAKVMDDMKAVEGEARSALGLLKSLFRR